MAGSLLLCHPLLSSTAMYFFLCMIGALLIWCVFSSVTYPHAGKNFAFSCLPQKAADKASTSLQEAEG